MALRTGAHVLASLLVATLAAATGCEGDEDDCEKCCSCQYDGSPFVYRPGAATNCASCEEQCQRLADREYMGNEFDFVEEIECRE